MKDLPQEVLDEIISHLPSGDLHSLQYCSLVAKSWIYPSRRRLFEFIPPLQEATLWSWLNYVSPKNVELLQHVRAISVVIADPLPDQRSGAPTDFPHNGSSLFPCLKRLVLYSGTSPSVARLGVSLASQRTLVYLALYRCRLTISTLATLINHFPNLVHLQLLSLYHDVDDDPISALSRPLQNLSANEADYCDEPSVLDQLLELKPQCVGVTISVFPYLAPSLTQRIIDGVEETVKCLNLRVLLRCKRRPECLSYELLNETPRFCGRSARALDTRELPTAIRAHGLGSGCHGTGPHLDHHLHAHSKDYVRLFGQFFGIHVSLNRPRLLDAAR